MKATEVFWSHSYRDRKHSGRRRLRAHASAYGERGGGVMSWLREVFWGLQAITAWFTVIPVVIAGALMALVVRKVEPGLRRVAALAAIVVAGAVAPLALYMPGSADEAATVVLPVMRFYPYLNMGSLLFLWAPLGAELLYVLRQPEPRPWIGALVGFATMVGGYVFLMAGAVLIGAPMD